jgi:serine/threonine protein kinase
MQDKPFGRYILRDLLGQGGMGQVYRAFDTATRREVALKLLPEQAADDLANRRRFEREAYAAASLNEPHIVPIFDFGAVDSRLYLAMQLVDGTDIGTLLTRNGPFSPEMSVSVIEQIASALDTAHAANVIHRDVKPSNILLTRRNFAYLIDFGIARAIDSSTLTGTGRTVGTLAYMAPERLTSGRLDAASDIYSLACVLHECLTGSRPFPGNSLEQQVSGHLKSPPPRPSVVRPGIPQAFDAVVARGMAKNPVERFDTAGELGEAARAALSSASAGQGPRMAPPVPPTAAASGPPPVPPFVPPSGFASAQPPGTRSVTDSRYGLVDPEPAAHWPPPRPSRGKPILLSLAISAAVLGVLAIAAYGFSRFGTNGDGSTTAQITEFTREVGTTTPLQAEEGTYGFNYEMYRSDLVTVQLTNIVVLGNGQLRVNLRYDSHKDTDTTCPYVGAEDLRYGYLTLDDGSRIYMTDSFCSTNYPNSGTFRLNAGGIHTSWGVFPQVPPAGEPFSLTWYGMHTGSLQL